VVGYTTVKADNINLQYILYIKETDSLNVSDQPFHVYDMLRAYNDSVSHCIATTSATSFKDLKYNIELQSFIGGTQNSAPVQVINPNTNNLKIYFYELGYAGTSNQKYHKAYITGRITGGQYDWEDKLSSYSVYTNCAWSSAEKQLVKSYSNDLDNIIGVGITEETIINIVNNSINSTTHTYNEATSIYNTIKNNYTLYQKGNIDKATMQANLTQAINQLNELNNNSGNTLADLMAINNALTYAQTIQQELLLKPESSVTTSVQTILQAVSNLVQQYQSGKVTQAQTMQELRGYAYQLAQLLTTDISISDVEVINTGTNVVNNFIEIISNNSEFNKDVSDRSQLSDKEELDFIESIETEKSVEDLAPSKIYIQGQASTADNNTGESLTDLFNAVWNNAIVKIMVPIFAGFAVIAVIFGRKYKL
jgi:hypothetical protein